MKKIVLKPSNPNNEYLKKYSKAVRAGYAARHVVAREDGWAVIEVGAKRASVVLPTKEQAISEGRKIAQNRNSELIVHKRNGEIEKRYLPEK